MSLPKINDFSYFQHFLTPGQSHHIPSFSFQNKKCKSPHKEQHSYYLDPNKFLPSTKIFQELNQSNKLQHSHNKSSSLLNSKISEPFLSQRNPTNPFFSIKNSKQTQKIPKISKIQNNQMKIIELLSEKTSTLKKELNYLPISVSNNYNTIFLEENIRKIDLLTAKTIPLSKESFYNEFHNKLYEEFISSRIPSKLKKQAIEPLIENQRFQIVLPSKTKSFFSIKINYNGIPIKLHLNPHSGIFLAFVSFKEIPSKETHDYIFNNSPFIIDDEELYNNDMLFLTIEAISQLKLSVCFCFLNKERSNSPNSFLKTDRKDSVVSLERMKTVYNIEDQDLEKKLGRKKNELVKKNKIIAKNYLLLKDAFNKRNIEDQAVKQQKALYNSDKMFFLDNNKKTIQYLKKRNKKKEIQAFENEKYAKSFYISFVKFWAKNIIALIFIEQSYKRFKRMKIIAMFLQIKNQQASKIQQFFRHFISKKRVLGYNQRLFFILRVSLNTRALFFCKKTKLNAEIILSRFFRETKRPFNLFICLFKTQMKLIFMKNKLKQLRKSQQQRMIHMKRLWEQQIQILQSSETESLIFSFQKITEIEKEKALRDFLNKKKMDFFHEIQAYLAKKALLGRKNTIVLKFLASASEKGVPLEDIELTEMSKQSIFYRSVVPYKKKPTLFEQKLGNFEKPYSSKHLKIKKEGKNKKGKKIEEPKTLTPSASQRRGGFNEKFSLQRPVFKYLPTNDEMKQIIMKVVEEIIKKQD